MDYYCGNDRRILHHLGLRPQLIKIWKQGGRDLSYGMLALYDRRDPVVHLWSFVACASRHHHQLRYGHVIALAAAMKG
jgi:hypothetical protein